MFRSLLYLILRRTLGLFRSDERSAGEAELEIAVLRHQLAVLRRQVKRPVYRASDRAFLAAASRLLRPEVWGSFLVRPDTVLRWHRQERFKRYSPWQRAKSPLACRIDAASLWSPRMWTEKVPVWRGYSVWAGRPNRTYPAGRVCDADGCDTRLSIYNGSRVCWQHEPARIRRPRGQRKEQYAA